MNKELLKRWITALRSGDYEQHRGSLCSEDGGFCCLGVLRDIEPSIKVHSLHPSELLGNDSLLQHMGGDIQQRELAEKNDHGMPFPEIADYIEKMYLNNEGNNT